MPCSICSRARFVLAALAVASACHRGPSSGPEQPSPDEPTEIATTSTPTTADAIGPAVVEPDVSPKCPPGMGFVPGGELTPRQREEFHQAHVGPTPERVEDFCLDLTEVAEKDWEACCITGGCCTQEEGQRLNDDCRKDPEWCGRHGPFMLAESASAANAVRYCEVRGGRVSTLTEWLWAASGGGEDRPFPWGDAEDFSVRANLCGRDCYGARFCDPSEFSDEDWDRWHGREKCMEDLEKREGFLEPDGYVDLAPVDAFPLGAGRWGHLNMAGNAPELVRADGREDFLRVGSDLNSMVRDVERPYTARLRPYTARRFIRDAGFRCAAMPN